MNLSHPQPDSDINLRTGDDYYDVVVVGASIAGCTTAIQLGRAGLRVALLDRVHRPDAYKAMCGHWILGGTQATLRRLGLWEPMIAAGGEPAGVSVWTEGDWIADADGTVPEAIGMRRELLDPLLRSIAASTPGVDLRLGCTVRGVIDEAGRVAGVRGTDDAGSFEVRARLTVGADGHHSATARAAGVAEDVAPNNRFFFWSYYRGVTFPGRPPGLVWRIEPDAVAVVPAGDGVTLVGAFFSKARLGEFEGDRRGAIERSLIGLPDAPDLSAAEPVGRPVGTSDYPLVRRHPVPRPGLALVGDAAMASDPLPAVGCGWAFRSAEWLADAVIRPLVGCAAGADIDEALVAYVEAHRFADAYDDLSRTEALAEPIDPGQRAVRLVAHHDRDVSTRMRLFAMRAAPPSVLLNPEVKAKAAALLTGSAASS